MLARLTPHAVSGTAAPTLPLLLREVGSFAAMRAKASLASPVQTGVAGDGRTVLVLPGFLASDVSTRRLRTSLDLAGFRAFGWDMGRNFGVDAGMFDRLEARVDAISDGGPVTIVGWSLGGLIGREFAKFAPAKVAKVVTLGSPFSGNMRANNAWRLYEWVAGYGVDNPPIPAIPGEKPPVPTIALWSRRDGIVAPVSARGEPDESDHSQELDCTHMAFVTDPEAIRAICRAVMSQVSTASAC